MTDYVYRIVDVFTERPLEGNSLAVFPDARGLDDDTMQRIAREMNLSETTFVFPSTRPDCAANVRIFTPRKEMQFAGHPTIGTASVLLEERLITDRTRTFALEQRVGPVSVRTESNGALGKLLWLRTPRIEDGPVQDLAACAAAVRLSPQDLIDAPPQLLSAGNPTVFIPVRTRDAVDRAEVDSQALAVLKESYPEPFCVFVFWPTRMSGCGAYSRMFAPDYGVPEDPATGSSTGPLAAFMMRNGLGPSISGTRFWSEQGTRMNRRSILHVLVHGDHGSDGIDVGGHVSPVARGVITI